MIYSENSFKTNELGNLQNNLIRVIVKILQKYNRSLK